MLSLRIYDNLLLRLRGFGCTPFFALFIVLGSLTSELRGASHHMIVEVILVGEQATVAR